MAFVVSCGVALSSLAIAVTAWLALRRPTAWARVEPRPIVYRNIRVVRDHDEVRDLARRACEREQLVVTAAGRRGARFGELMTLRPPGRSVR
jgi:hypothetical protein